jgi:hypothetical protein
MTILLVQAPSREGFPRASHSIGGALPLDDATWSTFGIMFAPQPDAVLAEAGPSPEPGRHAGSGPLEGGGRRPDRWSGAADSLS